ncbi:hypothetical protein [Pontibacter populi]|uniref:STAS/SEC14 domain-containing protein n=1 Tax=Pontibacter populi TaxID=890055 RepID=A0ABV1RT61_9BACT
MTTVQTTAPLTQCFSIVYQDNYINIQLNDQLKFVYVEWLQHPPSEVFRQNFMKAVETCIDKKCEYWLSDSRAIHYLEFADQNWILELVYPLLPKANLLKFARVNTLESIALMDGARVCNTIEQLPEFKLKTQLEVFSSKEAALNWLFDGNPVAGL